MGQLGRLLTHLATVKGPDHERLVQGAEGDAHVEYQPDSQQLAHEEGHPVLLPGKHNHLFLFRTCGDEKNNKNNAINISDQGGKIPSRKRVERINMQKLRRIQVFF